MHIYIGILHQMSNFVLKFLLLSNVIITVSCKSFCGFIYHLNPPNKIIIIFFNYYFLFQVVAIEGVNSTGEKLVVNKLCTVSQ